jgi:hypothetical protein
MTLRTSLKTLLGVALALPLVQSVLVGLRTILRSMGDEGGATFIGYLSNVCLAAWLVTMAGLGLVTAAVVIVEGKDRDGGR